MPDKCIVFGEIRLLRRGGGEVAGQGAGTEARAWNSATLWAMQVTCLRKRQAPLPCPAEQAGPPPLPYWRRGGSAV